MNQEFVQTIIKQMLSAIDVGTKNGYHLLWDTCMKFLTEHWLVITIFLTTILIIAVVRAFSGYWGMLGSVLYNYLFFGILFVVGLIKGPNIFASEYLEIFLIIVLYPACYFIVGMILNTLKVKRIY